MNRRKIITDYKAHFGLNDIPFSLLGSHDKAIIDWAEQLVNNCKTASVSGNTYLRTVDNDAALKCPKCGV